MPEYLAPGVYVEETSFRSKSIEGVGTTTTGFVGPARYGPVDLEPDLITSLPEFERVYGDGKPLDFEDTDPMPNYLWHAARAFFEEGGRRLYVARTYKSISDTNTGHATAWIPPLPAGSAPPADPDDRVQVRARFPGSAGRMRVRVTVRLGQNVLGSRQNPKNPTTPGDIVPTIGALLPNDIVWITAHDAKGVLTSAGEAYRAERQVDSKGEESWTFVNPRTGPTGRRPGMSASPPDDLVPGTHRIRVITMTLSVFSDDPQALPAVWTDLPLDPAHERFGIRDSFAERFAQRPANLALARSLPLVISAGKNLKQGLDVFDKLVNSLTTASLASLLDSPTSTDDDRSFDLRLDGGNDGVRPTAREYEGDTSLDTATTSGLSAFEALDDISIVAAPGATDGIDGPPYQNDAKTIVNLLISHAERMRYRIAVLDSGKEQTIQQVRALRAKIDSKHAALYYPWVRILDPITGVESYMPPSGFVSGIYARNDIDRGVWKAPANEVVRLAIGFEQLLNKSQQDVLNPEGINCFRFFEGRGFRLWGARTISSDPEWKYVNLRRYFAYLEHSIDKGTQWAVFEPNGDQLWANVRRTIEDFLLNEWQMGALLGDKPEKAYFVRCDRSTMTQNDLDNGRLVCLIGVAPLRPAEFVIFRIGQWTADRKI